MKTKKYYVVAAIGLLLLVAGLCLVKMAADPQGIMQALPYVCIGIGCGMLGHGMASVISQKAIAKYPDIQKQKAIEENDERNVAIGNRAKAKAFDVMTFVIGALMLTFALMNIDLAAILLLVFAYLFIQGCGIYYRGKYEKEM